MAGGVRHPYKYVPLTKTMTGRRIMTDREQAVLMKEIQVRFDRKLKESEIDFLEYWKEQVDQVAALKPEGVAALQARVRKISEMMANRIRTLKREP
jgi:hypothetical protein